MNNFLGILAKYRQNKILIGNVFSMLTKALHFTPPQPRKGLRLNLFSNLFEFLLKGDSDSVLQHQLFSNMSQLASDKSSVASLHYVYKSCSKIKNLELSDQDKLSLLAKFRIAQIISEEEYKQELEGINDKSEVGNFDLQVKYAKMNAEERAGAVQELMSVKFDMGLDNFKNASSGFLSPLVDFKLRMLTRDYFYEHLGEFFTSSNYRNGSVMLTYLNHGGDDFDYMLKKYQGVSDYLKEKDHQSSMLLIDSVIINIRRRQKAYSLY